LFKNDIVNNAEINETIRFKDWAELSKTINSCSQCRFHLNKQKFCLYVFLNLF